MHRSLVPQTLRQSLAGLLVCALLLTQALGLLHRLEHAEGPASSRAERSHGVLEALFAQHQDEHDCQIYDQLSHADGVGFAFVAPGTLPPAQQSASNPQTPVVAARAAGYLARGPPGTA